MASMMASQDPTKEERVVGIKLEISPHILPRDTSIGTKIFMLVPNEAATVRDVKSYIASFVLKTPSPFYIYMGEYRIRDEEDAQIFSIINEPCRLVAVPVPRSALSSTPKLKSADKRVTFFDGDLSTSPVHGLGENGLDVTDVSQPGRNMHTPQEQMLATTSTEVQYLPLNDDQQQGDLSDSSSERKKRRRRRHRNKKSKHSPKEDEEDEDEFDSISQTSGSALNSSETSHLKAQDNNPNARIDGDKIQLDVLNEETESEDETAGGLCPSKDFEFVTPISNKLPRKRSDNFDTLGGKRKKLSDSAFESSCSFVSPTSTSDESRCSTGKPRQDTPIVPRVVRNPKIFDSARKIFASVDDAEDSKLKDDLKSNTPSSTDSAEGKDIISAPDSKSIEDLDYERLGSITCADDLNVGDRIAFKVLELDERYNPGFSAFKEGIVFGKMGTQFRIIYTKNQSVVRTGIYDVVYDKEDSSSVKDENEKQEIVDLYFNELLELKLISQQPASKNTSSAMESYSKNGQPMEGNGYPSPPPSAI